MKKPVLLLAAICLSVMNSFGQFTFIHMSDIHVSASPAPDVDTNAQYYRCAAREFENLSPKPSFVIVTGDIADVGNLKPDGMYPTITQFLYPPLLSNPEPGDYFIDSARTIPIFFTPGNHEYWEAFDSINIPISTDTLFYYPKYITPDTDYVLTTELSVIVFMRSGHDTPYGYPPDPGIIQGTGFTNEQCSWLRNVLAVNSSKRKIIVMHHPAVNAAGTNSDGTPYTASVLDTATNSLHNNRTNFLNICDSNHVDVVLNGHEHQNVVANRKGDTIGENFTGSGTRYVQTAAAFNRSYRIITVDKDFVTVGKPMRSCRSTGLGEVLTRQGISVFPNPAGERVTISCTGQSAIEILSIEGIVLKKLAAHENNTTVDLSGLTGGIYLVRVWSDQGIAVRKLIKQ